MTRASACGNYHLAAMGPGTTWKREGECRIVQGGRPRAQAAGSLRAAACAPAGSELFEYSFATSYRLGLCLARYSWHHAGQVLV